MDSVSRVVVQCYLPFGYLNYTLSSSLWSGPTYSHFLCSRNDPYPSSWYELCDREKDLHLLNENLRKAPGRMKQNADEHRMEREFSVGDWIYLRLQPYRQSSVSARRSQKLVACYFGPFQVLEKIGQVAYRLDLPAGSKLHPWPRGYSTVPSASSPSRWVVAPTTFGSLRLLARRIVKRGPKVTVEVLIHWRGTSDSDATWERYSDLEQKFPQFILEDKERSRGMD